MKLSAESEADILRLVDEGGASSRSIAAWLQANRGVTVSHALVARFIGKRRDERAAVAKVVVRERLSRTLTADIDRLELFVRKAMRIARECENEPEVWVKVAAEVRKFTEAKLKAAGVDQPDDSVSELAAAADRVRRKLAGETG